MTQLARCSARQEEAQTPSNAHLAFYLTGNQSRAGLNAIGELGLRPALLAPYRDLTALRYDFPLVLVDGAADCAAVQSLSGLFDSLMKRCADGPEGERLRKHALRLEREIRARAGRGTAGSLSQTWEESARHLRAHGDALLEDILKRLRAALDVDGELVDCNAEMASRLCRHLWRLGYHRKAQRFRAQLETLTAKLAEILRADFAGSEQGRSAEQLRESFGSTHRDAFDFAAMSRLLAETLPTAALSDRRRERISWLLAALRSQRFFPADGIEEAVNTEPYSFIFTDCDAAVAARRERRPQAIALAKALAMARLEVEGGYNEARHDVFFGEFGADGLDPINPELFPDYLICLRARDMRAQDYDTLLEALSAGLRAKVLLEVDDMLEPSPIAPGNPVLASRSGQIARTAMDLNTSYVLQSSSANLFALREMIARAMAYPGSSLLHVFTGGAGAADLPPVSDHWMHFLPKQ